VRTLSPTLMAGKNNIIRKCQVTYSEAPGILVNGSDNTVENCWFSEIDWRGLGQGANTWTNAGVHMGQSATSTFRRNTVYNVGASAGVVLPGMGPSICEWNHLYNVGYVQSDGAMIQCNGINLNHTIIRYNWVHDHYAWYYGKTGIRADDLARNLIVHHNVVWNCGEKGIAMKGDRHQVHHNTCINNTWLDIVLWMAEEPFKEWAPNQHDFLIDQQNENSVAYNNLAPVLTGQMPYEIRNADSLLLPVAEMSHNRYAGPEILLGTSPLTFADDETLLANPAAQDFRPSENSPLIDAGRVVEGITGTYVGEAPDIGAYEYGGEYWIPGADWNPDSVFSIITEIDDVRDATTPNTYTLYPNYPNPFNPATNIRFKVPNSIQVQMDIFDISGRKVLTLLDKEVESGDHSVRWNGTNRHHLRVASGVYLVRMTAGPYISVQKMLLLN